MVLRCAEKYAERCAERLHTWRPARPHQHWVFGGAPSPTTRPPRVRKVGGLRVVGLGTFFLEKMAGAGGESWVDWNRCRKRWRLERGGN